MDTTYASPRIPRVPSDAPARLAEARASRSLRRSIERRKRRLAAAAILTLAVLVVATGVLPVILSAANDSSRQTEATTQIRVEAGETLWSVATRITPEGGSTAKTVSRLRELNGLTDAQITAGELLVVPAYDNLQIASR